MTMDHDRPTIYDTYDLELKEYSEKLKQIKKRVADTKRRLGRNFSDPFEEFDKLFNVDLVLDMKQLHKLIMDKVKDEKGYELNSDFSSPSLKKAYDAWRKEKIDPLKEKAKTAIIAQTKKAAKITKDAGLKVYNATIDWFLGDLRKKDET